MRTCLIPVALLLGTVPTGTSAIAQEVPTRELTCVTTKIASLDHRLQGGLNGPSIPDSGSAVKFANGINQVSYDELEVVHHARKGDPVLLCLIRVPRNCPPGDTRGRIYTATNLRTVESWTLPDSEHSCGGA